jgi:hypothetical protein
MPARINQLRKCFRPLSGTLAESSPISARRICVLYEKGLSPISNYEVIPAVLAYTCNGGLL